MLTRPHRRPTFLRSARAAGSTRLHLWPAYIRLMRLKQVGSSDLLQGRCQHTSFAGIQFKDHVCSSAVDGHCLINDLRGRPEHRVLPCSRCSADCSRPERVYAKIVRTDAPGGLMLPGGLEVQMNVSLPNTTSILQVATGKFEVILIGGSWSSTADRLVVDQ